MVRNTLQDLNSLSLVSNVETGKNCASTQYTWHGGIQVTVTSHTDCHIHTTKV